MRLLGLSCLFLHAFYAINTKNVDVKLEMVEMTFLNKSYYKGAQVEVYFYNRTTKGVRGWAFPKKPFDRNTMFDVKFAKFVSNEYRQGAIQYKSSLYKTMQFKAAMDGINKYCSPAVIWPLKTNVNYTCQGYVPEGQMLSNYVFPGKWRFITNTTNDNYAIVTIVGYVTVEEV